MTYMQQEEALLNKYEWIDQRANTIRIPIDRAMDVLAEQGLPIKTPPLPSPVPDATPAEAEKKPAAPELKPAVEKSTAQPATGEEAAKP